MSKTSEILDEVLSERRHQDNKWGYPQPAMRIPLHAYAILAEEVGEAAKALVEMYAAHANSASIRTWRAELRAELVQVAAVAMAWIEHLDLEKKP